MALPSCHLTFARWLLQLQTSRFHSRKKDTRDRVSVRFTWKGRTFSETPSKLLRMLCASVVSGGCPQLQGRWLGLGAGMAIVLCPPVIFNGICIDLAAPSAASVRHSRGLLGSEKPSCHLTSWLPRCCLTCMLQGTLKCKIPLSRLFCDVLGSPPHTPAQSSQGCLLCEP